MDRQKTEGKQTRATCSLIRNALLSQTIYTIHHRQGDSFTHEHAEQQDAEHKQVVSRGWSLIGICRVADLPRLFM